MRRESGDGDDIWRGQKEESAGYIDTGDLFLHDQLHRTLFDPPTTFSDLRAIYRPKPVSQLSTPPLFSSLVTPVGERRN